MRLLRSAATTSLASLLLSACSSPATGPAETPIAVDPAQSSDAPTVTAIASAPGVGAPSESVGTAHVPPTPPTVPPAQLTALSVGVDLLPAFDPSVHDYAVRCGAGDNAWSVSASAPDGVSLALTRPTTTAMGADAIALTVHEDDAVVVEATNAGGAKGAYWIRCLPHDFPQIDVVRKGTPSAGWYLLGNTILRGSDASFAMVLDTRGTPVWYRRDAKGPTLVTLFDKNVLAYSPLLGGSFGTEPAGAYQVLRLAEGTSSDIRAVGSPTDHHELLPLPSGNAMVLSYTPRDGADLSSRGLTETKYVDCTVQEIAADGSLVWTWSASEHFDLATESADLSQVTIAGEKAVDGFHCNSIDLAPTGDVLVSSRHMDAVFLVSRATGKVLWKLGGQGVNKDGAKQLTMSDAASKFWHQHDARFLPDGTITLFDNHSTAGSGVARGLEIALDLDAAIGTVTWHYDGPAPSSAMGAMRRQADGARVIGWGTLASPTFTEVDAAGKVLVEGTFASGDCAYRTTKVTLDRLDGDVLRRTAGAL